MFGEDFTCSSLPPWQPLQRRKGKKISKLVLGELAKGRHFVRSESRRLRKSHWIKSSLRKMMCPGQPGLTNKQHLLTVPNKGSPTSPLLPATHVSLACFLLCDNITLCSQQGTVSEPRREECELAHSQSQQGPSMPTGIIFKFTGLPQTTLASLSLERACLSQNNPN